MTSRTADRRARSALIGILLAASFAGCQRRAPIPENAHPLAITLKAEGGLAYLPGLQRPTTLDTAHLPAADARTLEDLVRRADFFALPPAVGHPRPGAADVRTFEITVRDGDRTHTVRAVEPIEDPALDALIRRVQALAPPPSK